MAEMMLIQKLAKGFGSILEVDPEKYDVYCGHLFLFVAKY